MAILRYIPVFNGNLKIRDIIKIQSVDKGETFLISEHIKRLKLCSQVILLFHLEREEPQSQKNTDEYTSDREMHAKCNYTSISAIFSTSCIYFYCVVRHSFSFSKTQGHSCVPSESFECLWTKFRQQQSKLIFDFQPKLETRNSRYIMSCKK